MVTPEETRMLQQVGARLRQRFPEVEPDRLGRVVDTVFHELDGARVRDFVEILVEREAATRLSRSTV